MSIKTRIFYFSCRLQNEDGKELINEDVIKVALAHRIVKRWAYILHDKDTYSLQDEAEEKGKHGKIKPKHYHVVAELNQMRELEYIAKWFNLPENMICKAKGAGAFIDCVEYLTHESDKEQINGKYLYNDNEVKSNFDFRTCINQKNITKMKYGKALNPKDVLMMEVLKEGKTLAECYEEEPLIYKDNISVFKRLREEYLSRQDPPKTRINYYIYGNGGVGKNCCSKSLARALVPDMKKDEEIFFEVGSENALFDGYDGQPILIWNDCRAQELLKKLKSRGNVFSVFDTHPTKANQSIKFGRVNLINAVNIVNSVQPYIEFLETLVKNKEGIDEDKKQSYRRFPFIIPLHEDDFDFLVNKGFYYNNGLFTEYEQYNNIRGNFGKVRAVLKNNEELCKQIDNKMLALPLQKYNEVMTQQEEKPTEDLLKLFEHYGEQNCNK